MMMVNYLRSNELLQEVCAPLAFCFIQELVVHVSALDYGIIHRKRDEKNIGNNALLSTSFLFYNMVALLLYCACAPSFPSSTASIKQTDQQSIQDYIPRII
jgi:hypothetical protein